MADRRVNPRYPLILVAAVTEVASGMKLNARTSDVSRTGCYIDSLNPMPAGTPICVKLIQGGEEVEVRGTVMYVSPGLGMGVAFEENMPLSQRVILERWLETAARSDL
jgi:hypothetical protein